MSRNSILPNLESVLDESIVIGSTGSVASGKSTFLSALHAALGYNKKGIKIDKDALRGRKRLSVKPEAIKRLHKGVFRTNATLRPDSMPVYGIKDGKVYKFQFYAPGGHLQAVKLGENIDGLLYFVDLNLAKSCAEALEKQKTLRWGNENLRLYVDGGDGTKEITQILHDAVIYHLNQPDDTRKNVLIGMRKFFGYETQGTETIGDFDEAVKDLARYLASTTLDSIPIFGLPIQADAEWVDKKEPVLYKKESLGEVVQSMIDSHKYALSKLEEGIPVTGVGTHMASVYGQFPRDKESILRVVQDIFNITITKYVEYQAQQGIQAEVITLELANGPAADWHFVELLRTIRVESRSGDYNNFLLNTKNETVVKIAHDIMAKALKHKGIESEGFKVATFSKKVSDLTSYCA